MMLFVQNSEHYPKEHKSWGIGGQLFPGWDHSAVRPYERFESLALISQNAGPDVTRMPHMVTHGLCSLGGGRVAWLVLLSNGDFV